MLLEKKNGTVWAAEPNPNRKIVRALESSIQDRKVSIVVLILISFSLMASIILPLTASTSRVMIVLWVYGFIVGVLAMMIIISSYQHRPIDRRILLAEITAGNVEKYVDKTHFAFGLVEPLIEQSRDNVPLDADISCFFIETTALRLEIEHNWDAASNPKSYRQICEDQDELLERAVKLVRWRSDADELQESMRYYVQTVQDALKGKLIKHRTKLEREVMQIDAVLIK